MSLTVGLFLVVQVIGYGSHFKLCVFSRESRSLFPWFASTVVANSHSTAGVPTPSRKVTRREPGFKPGIRTCRVLYLYSSPPSGRPPATNVTFWVPHVHYSSCMCM
jgi:hypothetical protein